MKSIEELNALKEEVKALNAKLSALTEEELAQVTGGVESRDVPDMHGHVVSSYESTVNIILDGHKHEEYGAICHRTFVKGTGSLTTFTPLERFHD